VLHSGRRPSGTPRWCSPAVQDELSIRLRQFLFFFVSPALCSSCHHLWCHLLESLRVSVGGAVGWGDLLAGIAIDQHDGIWISDRQVLNDFVSALRLKVVFLNTSQGMFRKDERSALCKPVSDLKYMYFWQYKYKWNLFNQIHYKWVPYNTYTHMLYQNHCVRYLPGTDQKILPGKEDDMLTIAGRPRKPGVRDGDARTRKQKKHVKVYKILIYYIFPLYVCRFLSNITSDLFFMIYCNTSYTNSIRRAWARCAV
jgi:hypothetical protein